MGKEKEKDLRNDADLEPRKEAETDKQTAPATPVPTQAVANQQSNAWMSADKSASRDPDTAAPADPMTALRQFAGLREFDKATLANSLPLIKMVAVSHKLHDLAVEIAQIETFVCRGTLGTKFRVDQAIPLLQGLDGKVAAIYSALLQERVKVDLGGALKELEKTSVGETKHDALAAIVRSYRAAGTANAKESIEAISQLRREGLTTMQIESLVRGNDARIPGTEEELLASLSPDARAAYTLSKPGAKSSEKDGPGEKKPPRPVSGTVGKSGAGKSKGGGGKKQERSDSYGPYMFDPSMLQGATPETAKIVIGADLIMAAAQQYNAEHPDAPVKMPPAVAQWYATTDLVLSVGTHELTSDEVWDTVHQPGGWKCSLTRTYFDDTILPSAQDNKVLELAQLDHEMGQLRSQIELANMESCEVSTTTTAVPGLLDPARQPAMFDLKKIRVDALQARLDEYKALSARVASGETTLAAEREKLRKLAADARKQVSDMQQEIAAARQKDAMYKGQSSQVTGKEMGGLAISWGESSSTMGDYERKASEMQAFADQKTKLADELEAGANNQFTIVTPRMAASLEKESTKKFQFTSTDLAIMSAVKAGAEDTAAFFLRVGAGAMQLSDYTPTGIASTMPLPGYSSSLSSMIQGGLRNAAASLEQGSAKDHQVAKEVLGEFTTSLIQLGTGALIQTAVTAGAGSLIGLLGRGAMAATSTGGKILQAAAINAGQQGLANMDKDGATLGKSVVVGAIPAGAAGFKGLLPKLVYTFFAAGVTDVVQSSNFTAGLNILTSGGGGAKAAQVAFADVDFNRVAANALVSVAGELAQHAPEKAQTQTPGAETAAVTKHFVAEIDGVPTYYRTLADGSLESLGTKEVPNAIRLTADELAAANSPSTREAALFSAENRAIQKDGDAVKLAPKQREARKLVTAAIEAQQPISAKDLAESKLPEPPGYRKSGNGDTLTYDKTLAETDRQGSLQHTAEVLAALQQHVEALRAINEETARVKEAMAKPSTPKSEVAKMTARLDELAAKAAASKAALVEAQGNTGEKPSVKATEEPTPANVPDDDLINVETDDPGGVSKELFAEDLRRMMPEQATSDAKGQQFIEAQWKNRSAKIDAGSSKAVQVDKVVGVGEKPLTADEIKEANDAHEDQFSTGDRDEFISKASREKNPAQSLPEVCYTTIDAKVLESIMEKGLVAGKALGGQGPNADAIWFKQGAPFYGAGITLAIPTKRLLELGGQKGHGLAGQSDIVKVPFEALPGGIPFKEFAIVSSVGQNYIEPIYVPESWKGPLGVGYDEKTKSSVVLGTKASDGEVNPAAKATETTKAETTPKPPVADEQVTTPKVPTEAQTTPTETKPTKAKPTEGTTNEPVNATKSTTVESKPVTSDGESSVAPTSADKAADDAQVAELLQDVANSGEDLAHNAGIGAVGSCTYAALQAVIGAQRRGWKAQFVVIDGEATASSKDASLGTTGAGAGTVPFAHALAEITLPDGSKRYVSWGGVFDSLASAVASNPKIVSYSVRGRYSAYEQTMALLNDNGFIRPTDRKSEVPPGANNSLFDPSPDFTPETHPWKFTGLELDDGNVLTQYASNLKLSSPQVLVFEAFTPAGEGMKNYLEKLNVNGVEQYFTAKHIQTRFRVRIVEATNATGQKYYLSRRIDGTLAMAATLDGAVRASRIGDREYWNGKQVAKGDPNDGTVQAYKQHQEEANQVTPK